MRDGDVWCLTLLGRLWPLGLRDSSAMISACTVQPRAARGAGRIMALLGVKAGR